MSPTESTARPAGRTRWPGWVSITLAYTLLAVVMTWPLTRDLGTWIAWDMGDPAFNAWVIMWTGGQLLRTLGGDFSAIHDFWNGNIFYPETLTIAYSEHLTPQMLQALPIWTATGNIVLAYNVVFLLTYILSGVAMYYFVRDLTKRPAAAFLAGVAFAFAPYRISQSSHVQVLSSYWMPFVLLGFRRFFETRRTRPLAGAAAALTLQNLSCGYLMLFFAPFALVYPLYEIWQRRLWRDWRVWRSLGVAALAVAICTWPFVSPYLELRKGGDVGVRSFEELMQFSADTHAFATASGFSRLWGASGFRLLAYPRGEGEGFPGFTILILAAAACVWGARRAWRASDLARDRRWVQIAAIVVGGLLVIDLAGLLVLLMRGNLPFKVAGRAFRNTTPLIVAAAVLPVLLFAIVPACRRAWRALYDSGAIGFWAIAAAISAFLALGPRIQVAGQILGPGPYAWLWGHVPGFDGIRAPARFLMLVSLFLAVLAGLGVAALLSKWPRAKWYIVSVALAGMLADSWVVPMPTNVRLAPRFYELTPRRLLMGDEISPIYQFVKAAPGKMVLIEFPFGEPAYEILATFYAGYHRKPIVNGYSGFFPEGYLRRATFLKYIPFDFDAATKALSTIGATHALVHEGAFPDGRGHEISDWLASIGATSVMTHGTDKLLQLPERRR